MIFLKKAGKIPRGQRRALIENTLGLILRQPCALLNINRSTLYYQGKGCDVDDMTLLNVIRDSWERYPFFGYRRITKALRVRGLQANCKRVYRLMALGGI